MKFRNSTHALVGALGAVVLAACGGSHSSDGSSEFSASVEAGAQLQTGFGKCVPLATTRDAVCSSAYGGKGTAALVSVAGIITATVASTGALPAGGGHLSTTLATVHSGSTLSSGIASASADGAASDTVSASSIAGVHLTVAGLGITADVISANAHGSCVAGSPAYASSVVITNLVVNGIHINASSAQNQVFNVLGLIRVGINEVVTDASGVSVVALHVTALAALNAVDVRLASASAYVSCCADPDPDPPPAPPVDAGLPGLDASLPIDASLPGLDASLPSLDAGLPGLDASLPPVDPPGVDAAVPPVDPPSTDVDSGILTPPSAPDAGTVGQPTGSGGGSAGGGASASCNASLPCATGFVCSVSAGTTVR